MVFQTWVLCRQSLRREQNEPVTARKTRQKNWAFRQNSELGKSVPSTVSQTAAYFFIKTFLTRWVVPGTKGIFWNCAIRCVNIWKICLTQKQYFPSEQAQWHKILHGWKIHPNTVKVQEQGVKLCTQETRKKQPLWIWVQHQSRIPTVL